MTLPTRFLGYAPDRSGDPIAPPECVYEVGRAQRTTFAQKAYGLFGLFASLAVAGRLIYALITGN